MSMFTSSPALAEWKLIEFTDEAAFYVDDFFERGPKTLIWELVDYKKPNKFGNLSAKILWEVDCAHSQMRSLMFSSHPYRMGIGEPLSMDKSAGEWEVPAEDSAHETIFVLGCGFEPQLGPKT
ncbi:MAG: hypothetical protein LW714_05010 [Oxalobacteraceae bacterium]|nr:hypothetical protein [Oxalobacteraceae bacterium]